LNDKDILVLKKIIKYVREALLYTRGMDFDSFVNDSKTVSATAFMFGQIGELAKLITDEMKSENPQIQWRGIQGLRNRIVHDYENVDMTMLWDVVKNDLPELLSQLESLM